VFHYTENGVVKRDYRRFISIKFILRSYGKGYKVSILLIMLQISAALALLKVATLITDFIILYLYPSESKRVNFARNKTEDSTDFSDKAYKIDYINFIRENQKEHQN
jgi:cellulase/cellobiase CelA1